VCSELSFSGKAGKKRVIILLLEPSLLLIYYFERMFFLLDFLSVWYLPTAEDTSEKSCQLPQTLMTAASPPVDLY